MNKQLFLMMGAPGSGKSTWAKRQLQSNDVYISRDEIRFNLLLPDEEYFAHEGVVFETFVQKITEALKDDNVNRVFADASHLNFPMRTKLLNGVRSYIDLTPIEVNVIWLNTTLKTCLERNNNRNGRALVPERIVKDMWDSQKEPTYREGINKVYIINEKTECIDIKMLNTQDENNFIF